MSAHPLPAPQRSVGTGLIAPLAAMVLALLTFGRPAVAGQVVLLRTRALGPYETAIAGFDSAYRGQVTQLTIEDTSATALRDRISILRPDVVVAVGLRAALFARNQLPRTPVVYCAVQNPERHHLDGAWITGVTSEVPPEVELRSLKSAAPDVRRVAIFFGRESGASRVRSMRRAATSAGLELIEVPLEDLSELADRAREVVYRADALWLPADPMVAAPEPFRFLLKLSLEQRKPLFAFSDALVRAGALAAVVPDYARAGALAAGAVRRIQAGERAGDIPPSTVQHTRLVINGATAKALGRELPVAVRRDSEVLP